MNEQKQSGLPKWFIWHCAIVTGMTVLTLYDNPFVTVVSASMVNILIYALPVYGIVRLVRWLRPNRVEPDSTSTDTGG